MSEENNNNNNNNSTVALRIGDVACGDSHTMVVTADEKAVYTWGMNKRGQLGLGDTATRHQPVKIEGLGELYTWGSGAKYRLMQANGDDSHRNIPTEVTNLHHY